MMTNQSPDLLPVPRAIIFDWDNTLVDSFPTIHLAINATMRAMDQPEWSFEETQARVALSLRDAFPKWFGDRWMEASKVFTESFAAIHLDALRPMAGAGALLEDLSSRDLYLAVVSNKRGPFLRAEAEKLGWNKHFKALIGAGDALADKPDHAPVALALKDSGLEPGDHVWFVGDNLVDMQCASNAGCLPVLIRAEAMAEGEFENYRPRHHFTACEEITVLLRQLMVPILPI